MRVGIKDVQRDAHDGGYSYGILLLCCVYQYQYILGDRLDRCPMLDPPKSQKLPIHHLNYRSFYLHFQQIN